MNIEALNIHARIVNIKCGNLEIVSDGLGINTKVYIDGNEINGIQTLQFTVDANGDNLAHVALIMAPRDEFKR